MRTRRRTRCWSSRAATAAAAPLSRRSPRDCGVSPARLTVIYAPTQSLAGSVQVVARVLEVALHKAHELKFPARAHRRRHGRRAAAAAASRFCHRDGPHQRRDHLWRTRAALRHGPGGRGARASPRRFRAATSRDYGAPFAEIFKRFKGDFYAIDPMLFSPAEVIVTSVESGESFRAGGARSSAARCLVRMTQLAPHRRSFIDDSATGTRARWKRAFTAAGAKAMRDSTRGLRLRHASTRPGSAFPASHNCPTPCTCALSAAAASRRSRDDSASCTRWRTRRAVWNDARAIERCVDKSMTSFLLAARHADAADLDDGRPGAAREIAMRETPRGPLVLKPLFGAQGTGLRLIQRPEDLPAPEAVAGVYYLQRYVPPANGAFEDHRLLVCAGAVIAAMTRRAGQWVTNLRHGGEPRPLEPSPDLVDLALRAASCVGARHAGVDLLRLRGRSRTGARSEQHAGLARPARRDLG